MEYILSGLWIALEMSCLFFFCGAFLERRSSKNILIVIVISWLIMFFYSNTYIDPLFKQICTVCIYTGMSMWIYKGKIFVHFFLVVVCYVFITVIDIAIVNGTSLLLGISYNDLVWRKLTYITITTIDKLLVVFFAWIMYNFHSVEGVQKVNVKWLALQLLFPLTSVAMLIVLVFNSNESTDLSVGSVVFSGVLAIANIGMLYTTGSLIKTTKQEHEMELLQQQIALQAENYGSLKENYSVQRKATHEFKRHIQTLNDLLENEEIDAARKYVNQLQKNRTLKIFNITANHPVIDVILNQKYQVAQENGINMQVQVNDLSSLSINSDELVVLLSNLLDNAIEACQKIASQREIHCSIILDDELYISIRNTATPMEIVNGEISTSKTSVIEHGYGLPAVKYILEQFNAEYTFNYSDGWFQFAAELQL